MVSTLIPAITFAMDAEIVVDLNKKGNAFRQLRVVQDRLCWLQLEEQYFGAYLTWDGTETPASAWLHTEKLPLHLSQSQYHFAEGGVLFPASEDTVRTDLEAPFYFADFLTGTRIPFPQTPSPIGATGYGFRPINGRNLLLAMNGELWEASPGASEWTPRNPTPIPEDADGRLDLSQSLIFANKSYSRYFISDGVWSAPLPQTMYERIFIPSWNRFLGLDWAEDQTRRIGIFSPDGTYEILPPVLAKQAGAKLLAMTQEGLVFIATVTYTPQNSPIFKLWRTDGTAVGTFPVLTLEDFPETMGSPLDPRGPYRMNDVNGWWHPARTGDGKIAFPLQTAERGWEVLISDGTVAGTRFVDILPGVVGSFPSALCFHQGALYAKARDADLNWNLWRIDPATGSSEIILPGVFYGGPDWDMAEIVSFRGALYFDGLDPEGREQLFTFTPGEGPPKAVTPSPVANHGSIPRQLSPMFGELFFSASEEGLPWREWYAYDPQTATVEQIAEGFYGFPEATRNTDEELHWSKRWGYYPRWFLHPLEEPSYFAMPVWFDSQLFGGANQQLPSVGNLATRSLAPYALSEDSDNVLPSDLPAPLSFNRNQVAFATASAVYFQTGAFEDPFGQSQWLIKVSGHPARYEKIHFHNFAISGAHELIYFPLNGSIGMAQFNGRTKIPLVYTLSRIDPSGEETLLSRLEFDQVLGDPYEASRSRLATERETYVLFRNLLWRSDGTHEGTQMHEAVPSSGEWRSVDTEKMPFLIDNFLYYLANGLHEGRNALVEYNLSTNDYRIVATSDLFGNFQNQPLIRFEESFLFSTQRSRDDGSSDLIWRFAPPMDQPMIVLEQDTDLGRRNGELVENKQAPAPTSLTVVGDLFFFAMYSRAHGRELWVSDGTAGGCRMVSDIYSGENDSNPYALSAFDNSLYFSAIDERMGRELFRVALPPHPWLGIFWSDPRSEWIYHLKHGWIHPSPGSGEGLWWYDQDAGWIWSRRELYFGYGPFWVYSDRKGSWLFCLRDEDPSRNWAWVSRENEWRLIIGI